MDVVWATGPPNPNPSKEEKEEEEEEEEEKTCAVPCANGDGGCQEQGFRNSGVGKSETTWSVWLAAAAVMGGGTVVHTECAAGHILRVVDAAAVDCPVVPGGGTQPKHRGG